MAKKPAKVKNVKLNASELSGFRSKLQGKGVKVSDLITLFDTNDDREQAAAKFRAFLRGRPKKIN